MQQTGAHKINKKVAMAQKNKIHIGLISVPKIEISKDKNKEARSLAIKQKMKDQIDGK